MPNRYFKAVKAYLADPDLMSLKEEVAIVSARTEELLARLSTGEHGEVWRAARGAFERLMEAARQGDVEAQQESLRALDESILRGEEDEKIWKEIRDVMRDKANLVDVHRKQEQAHRAYVTIDQVTLLVTAMAEIARDHIEDRRSLSSFIRQLYGMVGLWDGAQQPSVERYLARHEEKAIGSGEGQPATD